MYQIRRHKKPFAVPLLIAINVAVYLTWILEWFPQDFMSQNFLISWSALEAGRYWVLLTPAFSHIYLFHIFINMFVLKSFGGFMEVFMGRRRIFLFYIFAGIIGNFLHAVTSNFLLDKPDLPALGASGSVAGIILLFSLLFPKEKILFFGILPMPAIFGALAFVGFDLWGLYTQTQGGGLPIGHGAHLGGAFAGAIYFFWLKWKAMRIVRNGRIYD